jgi:endoglucanase
LFYSLSIPQRASQNSRIDFLLDWRMNFVTVNFFCVLNSFTSSLRAIHLTHSNSFLEMLRPLISILFTTLVSVGGLTGCEAFAHRPIASPNGFPKGADRTALLAESWNAYRQRFIQADGRVIDREDTDRSISEGQAYALLRAAIANDPDTFARVLQWSENNLKRVNASNQPIDSLWAWKWGRQPNGQWSAIDANFASDADIDAVTALILASRRWNRPEYLTLAKTKLRDLWEKSTVVVPADNRRYLLPGPIEAFQRNGKLKFNPSYLAPYAFRLFAQVDLERDWLSLVDSSYQMLEASAPVSPVNLPSDWIAFHPQTGEYTALKESDTLVSRYGFDATRVWWRVALDADWFGEPRAKAYLSKHLSFIKQLWRSHKKVPAQLDLQGRSLVDYEATSQYGMLYAAFRVSDPAIAREIFEQKLLPQYRNGFWDNDTAYYTQNLAWFGLLPSQMIAPYLSQSFSEQPKSQP